MKIEMIFRVEMVQNGWVVSKETKDDEEIRSFVCEKLSQVPDLILAAISASKDQDGAE